MQVTDEYGISMFRLLAGAVGVIPDVGRLDLPRMTQQQVEACAGDLELISLVVLTKSVREDSKDTISQIQDGSVLFSTLLVCMHDPHAMSTEAELQLASSW